MRGLRIFLGLVIAALAQFLKTSRFGYVSAVTAVGVLVGAAAMLFLERDAEASTAVLMMLYSMIVFGYLVSHAVAFIQGEKGQHRMATRDTIEP